MSQSHEIWDAMKEPGIKGKPDFGDAATFREGEIPVFLGEYEYLLGEG